MSELNESKSTEKAEQEERHQVIQKIYEALLLGRVTLEALFGAKTVHADLILSWVDPDYQKEHIGSPEEFQIVLATVKPRQTSNPHYHEVGTSTFAVLGEKIGITPPQNLLYRIGEVSISSKKAIISEVLQCQEGMIIDIPPYTMHQFENQSDIPAQLLIVTHPIISVKKGEEDIHFVHIQK